MQGALREHQQALLLLLLLKPVQLSVRIMKKKSDELSKSDLLCWHQGGPKGCKIKWMF